VSHARTSSAQRGEAFSALVHRGGLRADLLSTGTLRVGDVIAAREES